ncbi:acyl-CoA thioesterase [Variovorax sp. V118]|uniref:acyl-CoA thioesterase n=1 Tax=Variovorax sp. V118 TaxID=3065954 RepID=UPI0034E8E31F
MPTRWHDNDCYGHVNNVIYYSYFDTAVNEFLIRRCGLDIHNGPVIGLVVESSCRYHESISFPQRVLVHACVERLGRTSATYSISLRIEGRETIAARGRFAHVYVSRETRRPVPIPDAMRAALSEVMCSPLEGQA